jgi:competence ComEA-like helix-hairpin-helix protein
VEEKAQPAEPVPTAEETLEPSQEIEKPIAAGVVIPEEDEAFAWLESLAVRQGAEEALLLTPEERLESPPEWVIQEVAEAEETQVADTPGNVELPEWLQEAPVETDEIEQAAGTEASVPDWLKQPAAISEENPVEEELPPLAPELPTWLAGIEDAQKEPEAAEWSPTEESFETVESEALQDISEVIPEAVLEGAPVPALDLNSAGLIDLERLPGVGFTRAQAILDHREKHGPYQEVDELLLVTGITPDMLVELKQYLSIGGREETPNAELPAEDQQILLVQARNALVQGDIPLAISRYSLLIDKNQMLPDVITDLNEALYRFPIDVSIWEALGDAHMHAGHLQEALNAYTKAEEYLH